MASSQYYVAEKKQLLETCLQVWNACLCLDVLLFSHFIDTPHCSFTPIPSQTEIRKHPVQPDHSPVSKKKNHCTNMLELKRAYYKEKITDDTCECPHKSL